MNRSSRDQACLLLPAGRTSVPSVWINGECIGGCNDGNPGLLPLKESGRLESILREARALA